MTSVADIDRGVHRARWHALERAWAEWDPGVPLVRLNCERRSLGRPIAVREVAAAKPATRVTVLIPETEPEWLWQRLLQSQQGAVVAHALRRETDAVICRLRFRLFSRLPCGSERDADAVHRWAKRL